MSNLVSKYSILKEHNLVIEYHSGILEYDSFIGFVQKKVADPRFSLDLNHLIDFKDVTFNTNESDINKSVNFLAKGLLTQGNKRSIAILTSTPNQVVSTTLYKIKQAKSKSLITIEIFSTSEKALKWLKSNNIASSKAIATLTELKKG